MLLFVLAASLGTSQLAIPRVDLLPDRPTPYLMRDWSKTAIDFDHFVFDRNQTAPFTPLVWSVPNTPNLEEDGFGIPSYVGKEQVRGKWDEAITALGAVLGPTAVGVNKIAYAKLLAQYHRPGPGIVVNNVGSHGGNSFWYDLLPSVVFSQIASRFPSWGQGQAISKGIADGWMHASQSLNYDFDHTAYSFDSKAPFDNQQWTEPESAAAVAYIELQYALKSGNPKYLAVAKKALNTLQNRADNPTYEVLTPFGALSAAYLNAEKGTQYDVPRFVNWCFDPTSPHRVGWGMVVGKWGGIDAGGLMGSTTDSGGYAFAMNTYLSLGTLAPVARYDDRLSASLAKWILNAANASRLFYRNSLPKDHQSSPDWTGDPNNALAYEGVRKTWEGKSPYATGDAVRGKWAQTDLGLYGSGYVGLLGALVKTTNVPEILEINLRATDFLPTKSYPTSLYWNPYDTTKTVRINLGQKAVRLYDAVGNGFIASKAISGNYSLRIASKQAIQLVQVPVVGALKVSGRKSLVNDIAIDFNNGKQPMPQPTQPVRIDLSRKIQVPRADSENVDWAKSAAIKMTAGKMQAEIRFAWNSTYLFFRADQASPSTAKVEAPSASELSTHHWDFENLILNFDPSREAYPITALPEIVLGWSSDAQTNLVASVVMPKGTVQTTTGGSYGNANRWIEGKIAWRDLYAALGTRKPLSEIAKKCSMISCQPMLTDGNWARQAYLNGKPYSKPTGFDRDSVTLVLK